MPKPPAFTTKVFPWALLGLWLVLTALAFWWFQGQYQRPFATEFAAYARVLDSPQLPSQLGHRLIPHRNQQDVVTVLRFLDPGCGCNRFSRSHQQEIVARYQDKAVRFIDIEAGARNDLALKLQAWLPISSSPSAAVFDAHGRLVYFGPYSVGAGCFTGEGSYVERAIEKTLTHGTTYPQVNVLVQGCYCAWPDEGRGELHI